VRLGQEHTLALPTDVSVDLVVTSPGWRPDQSLLTEARDRGVPVWSEVELARRMQSADGPAWLAVTGTNGKTTVVSMLESILRAAGLRAVACGNVGLPVIEAALDPQGFDVLAVELSSFQLHWTEHVQAESAVVLGVTEDHLDWHGSLEAYAHAKGKIYEDVSVACVYNTVDPLTRTLVEDADVREGARAIGVGLAAPGPSEFGVVDGLLVDRAFVEDRYRQAAELASLQDIDHLGAHGAPAHMVFNALAAAALARAHGVEAVAVRDGLRGFRLGSHRHQLIARHEGIAYVDDSKATNPDAARASLTSLPRAIWIAGGRTKGADVSALVQAAADALAGVVLIGQDATAFEDALARFAPSVPVQRVDPATAREDIMRSAVTAARALAQDGDVVLLAPAAASQDQFSDYAERGELFRSAVQEITERG
jgi:UDP-N-acetylmuramoylalanine--D-glutamate ligase